MESKIRIDLNEKNEAVIIVEWRNSDDLRDKVVKQFFEDFGYGSTEAKVEFETIFNESGQNIFIERKMLTIKPVMKETHHVSEEDLKNNPDLKEQGVKVGDKIGMPMQL